MTPKQTFNRPAQEVIVDLLNQSLVKRFEYGKVKITAEATTFEGRHVMQLPALWSRYQARERASFSATIEGYQNSLQCNYYKLYLDRYIVNGLAIGSEQSTEEEILDELQSRYGVFFDPDEVVVDVFGLPLDDGTHRCIVRPDTSHLVWAGEVEVRLVPFDHLALLISERDVGDLALTGEPDIAQECQTFQINELVLTTPH